VLTFEVFNDWLPTDHCFVSVDEEAKDKYGVPVGVINLYGHPQDLKVGEHLAQKAVKVLEKMGCTTLYHPLRRRTWSPEGAVLGMTLKNRYLIKTARHTT